MTAMSSLTSTLPSAAEADAAIEQLTSSSSSSSTSSSEGHDFIMNVLNYATSYQSYHLDDGHESGKISAASSNPVSTSAETKTNNDDTSTATTATTTVLDKTGNNNNDNKNNAIIKEQQLMFQKSNEASDFIIQSIHRYFTNLKNKSESESNQDEDDHEKDGEDSNMEDVQSTIDEKTMKDKMEKLENEIIDLLWYVGMILEPTEPFQPPKQQTQQQAVKTTTTPSRKQGGVVHNTISSIHYKAFCIFIEQLHKNDILPTDKLANRLEVSTLGSLNGVIPKVIPKPNQTKPYAIPSVDPTDSKSSIVTRSQKNYFFVQLRKTQTSEIYRQKRFNLLQEESEGYAKLFNFLNGGLLMRYGSSGGSGAATGGGLNANGNNSNDNCVYDDSLTMEEQIDNVKDQITAYIGTFDLDPNRCLDITLDVLECQIKSMISSSSNVKTSMFDLVRHAPEYAYCVSLLLGIISMFPIDNVTHLIGFKFSNYKGGGSSSISDSKATAGTKTKKTTPAKPTSATKEPVNAHTTAPKSLFYTTAILASHDYLSLLTLKLHLAPSLNSIEEQYQLWRDEYMTKLRKKGTISLNASKDATAANKNKDNGNGNGSASIGHNNSQTRSFCDSNQLIQMLNIMIEIGLPWDMICTLFQDYDVPTNAPNDNLIIAASSMYSPLERNLCKYVKHLISDIYDTKVKVTGMDLKCNSSTGKGSSSTHVFGKYTLLPATQTHQHSLSESVTLLEFCDSIVKPLVPLVVTGAISSDPTLYCQICRLFRVFLKERLSSMKNTETKIVEIIQEDSIFYTLRSFIIPSLSLFPYNPAISSEVWSVISILPYEIRYAMYAFWREHGLEKAALRGKRDGLFPRKPLKQTESEIKTSLETKYMLKRMSKDNVRDMGKQISKVSHNNPLVVFTLILNQIESYDNLISIMVETFQFMGNLSLDVMGYCLLVSLGGGEKQLNRSKLKGKF
jgi:THO complex subunit 2